MAETKTERKVTVILATDTVGYSVEMEENEDKTLKNLKDSSVDSLSRPNHQVILPICH